MSDVFVCDSVLIKKWIFRRREWSSFEPNNSIYVTADLVFLSYGQKYASSTLPYSQMVHQVALYRKILWNLLSFRINFLDFHGESKDFSVKLYENVSAQYSMLFELSLRVFTLKL